MELKDLKDLLDIATKSLCAVTTEMRVELIKVPKDVDRMVVENLCLTSYQTCLDPVVLGNRIDKTFAKKKELMGQLKATRVLAPAAQWNPESPDEYADKLTEIRASETDNMDAHSLRTLITRGLKGVAQISNAAYQIGYEDEGIDPFLQRVLQRTLKFTLSVGLLFNLAMEVGGFGYRAMGLLDKAITERYGAPKLSNVELGVRKNPGILVAGQNTRVLECVLKAAEGTGVDVYTHGELLSAQALTTLQNLDHFAGNYGGSPETQEQDFASFHGPVIYAGTGVKEPAESYKDRFYTAGETYVPGAEHFDPDEDFCYDFSSVVEKAKTCEPPEELRKGELIIGFAHDTLYNMSDRIVGSMKDNSVERIIALIGTDGDDSLNGYYTALAEALPKNSAIMTAGSSAYRVNGLNLGTVHGIPRIMHAGQISDMYSIAMTALKFQADLEKFDLNGVPVTFCVAINDERSLLAFLVLTYIGAKKISVGTQVPDFMTENIFGIFQKNFGLTVPGDPAEDAAAFFAKKEAAAEGEIDTDMLIIDILERYPEAANILMSCGMSCVTCGSALYESLSEACVVRGLDPDDIKEVLDHELGLVKDED